METHPIPPFYSSTSSSSNFLPFSPNMMIRAAPGHRFGNPADMSAADDGLWGPNTQAVAVAGVPDSSGTSYGQEQERSNKKGPIFKKVRKPRHAFQTRSRVDILDDGYRWRKYGQKPVKNNKYPRSYYRCTHQGCGVKKQIQRLSKDETIVVTTYEGIHSHPIQKSTDNFEHILAQMQIYSSF